MAVELNYSNVEIDKKSKTIYDPETGEIIENDKFTVWAMVKNQKREDLLNKAKIREAKEYAGIEDKKDTHTFNWKKDSNFIKIYRTELREYTEQIKLSANAGLLLFYIQNYIEYETNRIAKPDRASFTNKELQELTGLGRDAVEKALKELEEKHFTTRTGNRQAREIYFNPYLICSGNEIEKETVRLFDRYTPCTPY